MQSLTRFRVQSTQKNLSKSTQSSRQHRSNRRKSKEKLAASRWQTIHPWTNRCLKRTTSFSTKRMKAQQSRKFTSHASMKVKFNRKSLAMRIRTILTDTITLRSLWKQTHTSRWRMRWLVASCVLFAVSLKKSDQDNLHRSKFRALRSTTAHQRLICTLAQLRKELQVWSWHSCPGRHLRKFTPRLRLVLKRAKSLRFYQSFVTYARRLPRSSDQAKRQASHERRIPR